MLGVNLQADRPTLVRVESHELLRRIGAKYIQSFQIGNEPNLYTSIAWYKLRNGRPVPQYSNAGTPVFARPPSYGPADFAGEVHRMLRVMPKFPVAGPEANDAPWIAAFTRFLHPAGRAVTLTVHAYAGSKCVKDPSQPKFPSVPHLLGLTASRDQLAGIDHYIGVAHGRGDGFRVDELGTISCSGRSGVSNSMASALWVLDTLFSMDDAGINGVNLHSVKGVNELLDAKRSPRSLARDRRSLVLRRADVHAGGTGRLAAAAGRRRHPGGDPDVGHARARSSCPRARDQRQHRRPGSGAGPQPGGLRAPARLAGAAARTQCLRDPRGDAGRAQLRPDHHRRPEAGADGQGASPPRRVRGAAAARQRGSADAAEGRLSMTLTHGLRGRTTALVAAVVAVVAAAGLWTGTARAYHATVTVSSAPTTRPLPAGFVGTAFTYSALAEWMSPGGPVNPVLVRLIRNLSPTGRPWLRIGGESADRSWWPISGYRKPIGITYDLGPAWTDIAHRLAHAINAQVMLGIELQANRPEIDKVEARQLLNRVGRHYVQSLQIGNEPELYSSIPWYKLLHGRPVLWYSPVGKSVYARSRSYGSGQFMAEASRILRAIPRYPIAGPETNIPSWTQAFVQFLKPGGPVNTLTTHAYGVNNCVKNPHSDVYPTVPNLVSLHDSRNILRGMAPYISQVHRRGGQYRIDEMGAVTCTGPAGVSDSMATALWAIDALFYAASQGVDGVNLHTDYSRINNLFSLSSADGRWRATVRPLYYGALMFERADPAGSRLLSVPDGTSDALRVWATQGRDHKIRIAIVNDSLSGDASVRLRIPGAVSSAPAELERLVAPGGRGAYATRGITLGGRSFGTTTTGVLGAPRMTAVKSRGGAFTVGVPKGSAALLTVDASKSAGCSGAPLPPGHPNKGCPGADAATGTGADTAPTDIGTDAAFWSAPSLGSPVSFLRAFAGWL